MALPAALNDVREKSSESKLSSGDFPRFAFGAAAVRQRGERLRSMRSTVRKAPEYRARRFQQDPLRGRIKKMIDVSHDIPGTTLFESQQARRGYALNKLCFSFNNAANRQAFLDDEDGYCGRFGLDSVQRDAVRRRDVLAMIEAGGNIYYLAKLAGIFGLSVQDIGAQQTQMSVEAFKAKLAAAGK
jgi:protocatechuate 4,5-dioxygenase alpha chain